MTIFKTLLIAVLFWYTKSSTAQTQSRIYDITINDINVGSLTASKQIEGIRTTYRIDSKSVVHVLKEIVITTSLISVFKNGILESSSYISEKNGNPYDRSLITQTTDGYIIDRKGQKKVITGTVRYVTCLLYFEKPITTTPYFDPLEAVYSPITANSAHTFTLVDASNNEKTLYTYLDNILQQGVTKHALYNFTFTLKNQSN